MSTTAIQGSAAFVKVVQLATNRIIEFVLGN